MTFAPQLPQVIDGSHIGSVLFPLLSSATLLCLVCPADCKFLHELLTHIGMQVSFVILDHNTEFIPKQCENVLFIDMTTEKIFRILPLKANLSWKNKIFIINLAHDIDISTIEEYSSEFKTSQLVLFLRNNTYYLSSPFDKVRCLSEYSDLTDVESLGNLHGRPVPMIDPTSEPFSTIRKYNGNFSEDGIIKRFLKDLSRHLNFTWEVVAPLWSRNRKYHGVWAYRFVSWSSKMMDIGRAEMMFGSLWTYENWTVENIQFGPVLTDIYFTWLTRRPVEEEGRWQTLHKMLSPVVWLVVILSFILTSLVCWVADAGITGNSRLGDSVMLVLQLLLLTGQTPRRSGAARILIFWSFYALLLDACFTSSIVHRFSLPVFSPRIDSIQQLVEGDYTYWKPLESTLSMNDSTAALKQEISRRLIEEDKMGFAGARIGADLVIFWKSGGFIAEQDKALFVAMKEDFGFTFTSINFRKDSVFHPALSRGVQRLLEAGLMECHRRAVARVWLSPAERRLTINEDQPRFERPEPLSLFKLKPTFYILLIGLSIALIVFLVEIM